MLVPFQGDISPLVNNLHGPVPTRQRHPVLGSESVGGEAREEGVDLMGGPLGRCRLESPCVVAASHRTASRRFEGERSGRRWSASRLHGTGRGDHLSCPSCSHSAATCRVNGTGRSRGEPTSRTAPDPARISREAALPPPRNRRFRRDWCSSDSDSRGESRPRRPDRSSRRRTRCRHTRRPPRRYWPLARWPKGVSLPRV